MPATACNVGLSLLRRIPVSKSLLPRRLVPLCGRVGVRAASTLGGDRLFEALTQHAPQEEVVMAPNANGMEEFAAQGSSWQSALEKVVPFTIVIKCVAAPHPLAVLLFPENSML